MDVPSDSRTNEDLNKANRASPEEKKNLSTVVSVVGHEKQPKETYHTAHWSGYGEQDDMFESVTHIAQHFREAY